MWRMVLVAMVVLGLYAALPRYAPGAPSSTEADSFGEPWTINSLNAAFQANGVTFQITDVYGTVDDVVPGVRQPLLVAEGTIEMVPARLLIYRTTAARDRIWEDDPTSPYVSVRDAVSIPEIYDVGAGNAVVVMLGAGNDAVRNEMLALRNR